uniref:Uncharacterized protein n=1 Tax=Pyrodinium bahamense TaxID=73915 RepID=A0A7S0F8E1_9DINO
MRLWRLERPEPLLWRLTSLWRVKGLAVKMDVAEIAETDPSLRRLKGFVVSMDAAEREDAALPLAESLSAPMPLPPMPPLPPLRRVPAMCWPNDDEVPEAEVPMGVSSLREAEPLQRKSSCQERTWTASQEPGLQQGTIFPASRLGFCGKAKVGELGLCPCTPRLRAPSVVGETEFASVSPPWPTESGVQPPGATRRPLLPGVRVTPEGRRRRTGECALVAGVWPA